jgi:hypothetical protein
MDQRQRRRRAGRRGAAPGILTLARVLNQHLYAVQRDILALGYRRHDMFTTLNIQDMLSIVVAAQPGTAIYHAVNDGWTLTDHLIATTGEQQAGLTELRKRILRPGVTDIRPAKPASALDHSKPVQRITFDPMTIEDFERRRRERLKGA